MFVAVPSLLAAAGQPADMTAAVRAYLLALLPNLWLDAVARWAPSQRSGVLHTLLWQAMAGR